METQQGNYSGTITLPDGQRLSVLVIHNKRRTNERQRVLIIHAGHEALELVIDSQIARDIPF